MAEPAVIRRSVEMAIKTLQFAGDVPNETDEEVVTKLERLYDDVSADVERLTKNAETFNRTVTVFLMGLDFLYTMGGLCASGEIYDRLSAELLRGADDKQ